mgnify:CR=1 FL=1
MTSGGWSSGDTVNLGANQQPDLEALFAAEPDLVLLTPDLDGQWAEDSCAAGIPRRLVQGGDL